jgi:hypothetical protein
MFTLQVFSPASAIFAGIGILLSVRILLNLLHAQRAYAHDSQAAKDVRASQGALIDAFERIESFFRRLEIYTEVPATPEMMELIVRIMVEVLTILGIATKEIKQGRTSE